MRKLMLTGLLALACASLAALADDAAIRLSEPVQATETYEDFGAALPENETKHSLGEAMAKLDDLAGQPLLIQTEVQQVCQKKGCFFIARDGNAVARVRFKDYGFFIPTDSAGKTVTLAGTLERVAVTPEQAAHFADDLGQEADAVGTADFEYQITATSVRIPKA